MPTASSLIVDPPHITADNLERCLASDDTLVHHFNEFLSLPSFPVALSYARDSGLFEVETGAAERCLDKRQGLQWVIAERLPLFVQSDCYFEYRLAKLLSQWRPGPRMRKTDDGSFGRSPSNPRPPSLRGAESVPRCVSTETPSTPFSSPSSSPLPCDDLRPVRTRTAPERWDPTLYPEDLLSRERAPPPGSGEGPRSVVSTLRYLAASVCRHHLRTTVAAGARVTQNLQPCGEGGNGQREEEEEEKMDGEPGRGDIVLEAGEGEVEEEEEEEIEEDEELKEKMEEEVEAVEEEEEEEAVVVEEEEEAAAVVVAREDIGKKNVFDICGHGVGFHGDRLRGLGEFEDFLRDTPGESVLRLWMDIERLTSTQHLETKHRRLVLMRSRHLQGGSRCRPSGELLSRLGLITTPRWTEERLRQVQPQLTEALLFYWAPRFWMSPWNQGGDGEGGDGEERDSERYTVAPEPWREREVRLAKLLSQWRPGPRMRKTDDGSFGRSPSNPRPPSLRGAESVPRCVSTETPSTPFSSSSSSSPLPCDDLRPVRTRTAPERWDPTLYPEDLLSRERAPPPGSGEGPRSVVSTLRYLAASVCRHHLRTTGRRMESCFSPETGEQRKDCVTQNLQPCGEGGNGQREEEEEEKMDGEPGRGDIVLEAGEGEVEEEEEEEEEIEEDEELRRKGGRRRGFEDFLRDTPGESVLRLWMDIERLTSTQHLETKHRRLVLMRGRHLQGGSRCRPSGELLSRLGLITTPRWTEERLRQVQPQLTEALLFY
ncbi:hypothetical protein CRUP_008173, partial [Coryphaenoides rupestris]